MFNLDETKVLESRVSADGQSIRRRRVSADGVRFTTYERIEKPSITVLKSHGGREHFDRDKLKTSIVRSVGKFISEIQIEEIINRVENSLIARGGKIPSRTIGEEVLLALFDIDKVAYIRFASVFNGFGTIDDFEEILEKIRSEK
ncbi:MAG: ATP cone domain-containing protein [bacterium]|nr:ATP cone domain-containing protein [bacterium]